MEADHPFGKQRLADFYMDPQYININHGSYGYTPKTVIAHKRTLEEQMQFNTEKWFRKDSQILITEMRRYVASKVNARYENIFLVQNATDAFNGLMKSIDWKKGDIVVLPNIAYSSIKKTMQWLKEKYQIEILQLIFIAEDLKSSESIQLKIQNQINKFSRKIRFAVFDHISSAPAIVFPIQTIKHFLDQKNIDLFVDAAHAMCQVDIDLTQLNCQAYFSNFHKWSFVPKNAAFLYVSDKYAKFIRPAITGNFKGEGIARQYFWTGTRDFTSYLCIQKGIQYIESFGYNAVRNYNRALALQGAKRMSQIWKTYLLTEDKRCLSYMVNIKVPTDDYELCSKIQAKLFNDHNIFMVAVKFNEKIFCRICAQIYNELSDYQTSAQKFLSLMEEIKYAEKNQQNKKQ